MAFRSDTSGGLPVLSEHTVADAARAAGIDVPATFVPVTGSTNSDLLEMADRGAPPWTVLVAGHQEVGRGRLGRTWVALPGSSLLVSVLLRPQVEASSAPLLSMAVAVSMAEACQAVCGVTVRSKWPNDLLAGDRPKKLAGILVEGKVEGGRLLHVVAGVGVNVMQRREDFPPELRDGATSVVAEGGLPDQEGLLRAFLSALRTGLTAMPPGGFVQPTLRAYRALCDTIGREVRAARAGRPAVEGRAVGIGERGELVVETDDGREVRIGFGEIEHLR